MEKDNFPNHYTVITIKNTAFITTFSGLYRLHHVTIR